MTQQRPTQPRRPERPSNGFYDTPQRVLLGGKPVHFAVCPRCGCFVPGGSDASKAQALHKAFHEQVDGHDQR